MRHIKKVLGKVAKQIAEREKGIYRFTEREVQILRIVIHEKLRSLEMWELTETPAMRTLKKILEKL